MKVASVITNIDGTPITNPSNFCRLYTDLILKTEIGYANCLKSDTELGRKSSYGPAINQFLSGGLWDAGARITVGGRHIANWIIGQVRDEKMDIHLMINYADKIGVDREDFLNALNEVPVMSIEKFTEISETLYLLANEYSEKAYCRWLLSMQTLENDRAAEAIKKSECLLSSIYDTIEDIIFQLKVESHDRFRFVSANHSFYKITGLTEKKVIGKLVSEVIPEPSLSLVLTKYRQAIKESSVIQWEEISDYPAGRLIGDVSISPVYDDKGKCTHLVGSVHDVTDRKLAEQALNESEELYRITIGSIQDPLFITSDTGAFTFICSNVLRILGYNQQELEQMGNISGLVGEHLFEINELNTHEIITNLEQTIVDKSGVERSFRITVCRVNIQGGTILWVFHDVTESIRAEEARKEIERAKTELLEKMNEAQQIASIGSWEWNLQTNKVWWSDETYRIFGVNAENFIPGFESNSRFIHPDDLEKYKTSFDQCLQTGEPLDFDVRLIDNNGVLKYCQSKGTVCQDGFGNPIRFVGTVLDITERKLALETLHAIEEKLHDTYLYVRSLIEASLDPLVTINTDGKITDINTATEKVTGLSRINLIGTDFSDYFTDPQKARTSYQDVFDKGYVIDYPLTIRHTSGQLTDVLYNASVYHDKHGVIVGIFAAARDITKRKMAEETLQKSEEKWRTIFEILPVGVSILDKNGNISEHNPALERILQLTAEELQGQQFKHRKYVYYENGEIRSDEYPTHISVQEQKIIRNIEVGVKKEDGDIIWTEVSAAPLNIPDAICAVVTTDITEHKRLEKELRRSELLLNNTQQLTHVGGWEWDVKKQSMFWTKGLYELYDLDPNKYIPGAPGNFDLRLQCYLSEDRTKIRNAFQQCVDEGVPYDYEFRFTTFKERSLWIRMIIKPVLKKEKVVKVIGVIMDIHERKLFEKELIEREINYTVLFNTVRQAIYIQNPDSTVISVNQGAVEMYGYEKEYFIGKTPEFLSAPGKNDMTQIMEYLKLAYQGRPQKYEFWGKKRNGIIFPEEIWTVKGKYFGQEVLISLAIDITERELAEAEIKRKNEELQKINGEKDKFFSIIAHDLKSPFTGFLGLTDLMVEKMSSMNLDEIHDLAKIMRTSANNLFRLLGNLLEWSSMQRGLTTFNPSPFLLMPKISEALILVLDGADKKKITIIYNVPTDLEVFADANMFGVIIRNLMTNAVKFTPSGGSITISAKSVSDKSVEISIKDTGIGMNAYIVDNLFRLDINTSRKGTEGEYSTGLGLVLSKDFIEKHKGKLWVESEEGNGSVFRFTLPGSQAHKTPITVNEN
jgi:PAS domain S-box-containing protein